MRTIEQNNEMFSSHFRLKKLRDENFIEFEKTFGLSVNSFWSRRFGFDMGAFELWIQPDDNESMKGAVLRVYGDNAANLIERLLKSQPPPPQVGTWTDEEYDPLLVEVAKFEKCEYTFYIDNGDEISGSGYYHGGLVVHRPHFCFGKLPHPQHKGGWNVSTSQGLHVISIGKLVDTKRMASAVAKACDLTKANTMNLTDAQSRALSRAVKILRREYIEKN